ncbi:hypothetical protein DPEC_G00254100 [Dallia pectoralis]|uniref:Uncharacterized protein n=1 Tax=Dallia pectoralis TaxID=75939 RepID=A0ACC2FU62_DALPE|nr:hypothetical protein DPEC_G00254100 [Dallia pectoralis]
MKLTRTRLPQQHTTALVNAPRSMAASQCRYYVLDLANGSGVLCGTTVARRLRFHRPTRHDVAQPSLLPRPCPLSVPCLVRLIRRRPRTIVATTLQTNIDRL